MSFIVEEDLDIYICKGSETFHRCWSGEECKHGSRWDTPLSGSRAGSLPWALWPPPICSRARGEDLHCSVGLSVLITGIRFSFHWSCLSLPLFLLPFSSQHRISWGNPFTCAFFYSANTYWLPALCQIPIP